MRSIAEHYAVPARLARTIWLVLPLLAAATVPAQEAVRNVQAGDTAAAARTLQMDSAHSPDYTFKDGDFQVLLQPSASLVWNDNIGLSHTNVMSDLILRPVVGLTASYPISQRNLLFIDISVGYDWYLQHSALSTLSLNSASGTGLSFDFGVKDFNFNIHDWISYIQDSAQTPNAANTANYGTFRNAAGISGTWDMNQVVLTLGYDHEDVLATSGQFNSINHSSEMLNARAGLKLSSHLTAGLEGTAAFTSYEQAVLNGNAAYTAGGYADYHPGQAFSATVRGGFTTYQFQNTSKSSGTNAPIRTGNLNSWYGSILLSHQPRESLSYSIEAGHEVQLGIQSDLVEDWYVRPSITWKIIKDMNFTTAFFYDHGNQGVALQNNLNLRESFDWYGGQLVLQQRLTKRLTLGAIYRLTLRASNQPNQGYSQNLIGLQLNYHPQ
jgi:hypothetical protein